MYGLELTGTLVSKSDSLSIIKRIYSFLNVKTNNFSFPGWHAVTLLRRHILDLINRDYFACEKSDGIRALLHVLSERGRSHMFFIDRKTNCYKVALRVPVFLEHDFLLDGEVLVLADGRVKFSVFDAVLFQSTSVMRLGLLERLRIADRLVRHRLRNIVGFEIEIKRMYKAYGFAEAYESRFSLGHGNDGLVFTCVDEPYAVGTCKTLYKWKPPALNTVDFEMRDTGMEDVYSLWCMGKRNAWVKIADFFDFDMDVGDGSSVSSKEESSGSGDSVNERSNERSDDNANDNAKDSANDNAKHDDSKIVRVDGSKIDANEVVKKINEEAEKTVSDKAVKTVSDKAVMTVSDNAVMTTSSHAGLTTSSHAEKTTSSHAVMINKADHSSQTTPQTPSKTNSHTPSQTLSTLSQANSDTPSQTTSHANTPSHASTTTPQSSTASQTTPQSNTPSQTNTPSHASTTTPQSSTASQTTPQSNTSSQANTPSHASTTSHAKRRRPNPTPGKYHSKIGEFFFNSQKHSLCLDDGSLTRGKWELVKIREDKSTPNSLRVVSNIFLSMKENITYENIVEHFGEIRANWKRREAEREARKEADK